MRWRGSWRTFRQNFFLIALVAWPFAVAFAVAIRPVCDTIFIPRSLRSRICSVPHTPMGIAMRPRLLQFVLWIPSWRITVAFAPQVPFGRARVFFKPLLVPFPGHGGAQPASVPTALILGLVSHTLLRIFAAEPADEFSDLAEEPRRFRLIVIMLAGALWLIPELPRFRSAPPRLLPMTYAI